VSDELHKALLSLERAILARQRAGNRRAWSDDHDYEVESAKADVLQVVKDAIAAERERCAVVARKHASGEALHTTVPGCAFAIEDEIRRGE
jgi:hypothetical protein